MSPVKQYNIWQSLVTLVLVAITTLLLASNQQYVNGAEVDIKHSSSVGATHTTLAPVNAMAAAAINDAVKHVPAMANLGAANIAASVSHGIATDESKGPAVAANSHTAGIAVDMKHEDATNAHKINHSTSSPATTTANALHHATSNVKPEISASVAHTATASASAGANASTNSNSNKSKKMDQYFGPVCDHLDKLSAKQMFKIQFQVKKFVELTNGKLGICFAQQYAFEPKLTPITKAQLNQICESRKEQAANKVQFKTFESCAEQNWETAMDKELERIATARSNCAKHHQHSKNDSSVSVTHEEDDDDDEVSVIGDVVGKVLGENSKENEEAVDRSSIKTIEIGPNGPVAATSRAATSSSETTTATVGTKTTATPKEITVTTSHGSTTVSPASVNVTVSTAAPAVSTAAPAISTAAPAIVAAEKAATTTSVPTSAKPTSSSLATATTVTATTARTTATKTTAPNHTDATKSPIVVPSAGTVATAGPTTTSAANHSVNVTTNTSSASNSNESKTVVVDSSGKSAAAAHATTKSPNSKELLNDPNTVVVFVDDSAKGVTGSGAKSTSAPAAAVSAATAAAASSQSTTTGAPASLIEKLLPATAKKLLDKSADHTTALPVGGNKSPTKAPSGPSTVAPPTTPKATGSEAQKKKEIESDAKKAIEALKSQRAHGHGSAADERMHQLEHDRQMSIDPVGHSIKHKIYELKKAGAKV